MPSIRVNPFGTTKVTIRGNSQHHVKQVQPRGRKTPRFEGEGSVVYKGVLTETLDFRSSAIARRYGGVPGSHYDTGTEDLVYDWHLMPDDTGLPAGTTVHYTTVDGHFETIAAGCGAAEQAVYGGAVPSAFGAGGGPAGGATSFGGASSDGAAAAISPVTDNGWLFTSAGAP